MAKDLHIPMDMNRALKWWLDKTAMIAVDAMQIQNKYHFLNVSVGLSSKALADVDSRDKKTFGWLAYFASGLQGLSEVSPHEFRIEVDGKVYERQAVEVVVANSGIVQFRNLRLDPEIKVNDGKLSVCVIQGKTAIDYFKVASEIIIDQPEETKVMKCYEAYDQIVIDADKELPVQADGDRIGQTPVTIKIVPSAVKFLTPGGGK
ncbi:MAG: hypothetical protein GWO08_03310 [Gammaproteobacteria bacterium]|nr:hypothetical protein [candidate division Zixibacteria bacterium]NIR92712.1 hypothetical protein [Gammaproteobacteria bacterium]NIS47116.1 hypothetical protein [candidate division Zixibacteria bacterium]NIU15255.1 hypothetical protein [candidate division Zixibacteria bacterium]NIV07324.1 hypothetical protein [candidate division Zixibacteria bacterium]